MSGRPLAIGSLFAAVLAKANARRDVMVFSDDAEFVTAQPPRLDAHARA